MSSLVDTRDRQERHLCRVHRGPGLSKARPLPAIPDSPHRPSLWQAAGGGALCVGIPGVRQAPSAPSCHPGPEPPTRCHAESSRHGSRTAAARTPLGIKFPLSAHPSRSRKGIKRESVKGETREKWAGSRHTGRSVSAGSGRPESVTLFPEDEAPPGSIPPADRALWWAGPSLWAAGFS